MTAENITPDRESEHHEHHEGHHHGHHEESFTITIKTIAGHELRVEVIDSELVAAVAVEATIEFREKGELANDGSEYLLSLPRSGPDSKLDPSSTLAAAGVHAGDVLLLISRAPHVDG